MGCTGSKDAFADLPDSRSAAKTFRHTKTNRVRPFNYAALAKQREAYWLSLRKDATQMLEDLDLAMEDNEKGSAGNGQLLPGELEYRNLLKRWLKNEHEHAGGESIAMDEISLEQRSPRQKRQRQQLDDLSKRGIQDPNTQPFPMPQENVDSLREYLRKTGFEPMNTSLAQGESAWSVLPADVIKNGLTTPAQQSVLASRQKRRKMNDPSRMRKRRQELAVYFMKRYCMEKSALDVFLPWADVTAKSKTDLDKLCR